MRLGGPIYRQCQSIEELIAERRRLGYTTTFCPRVADRAEREEIGGV